MSGLSHFDDHGNAHMVDVSGKDVTDRIATAEGWVKMAPATYDIIAEGRARKGDVIGIARLAGIMGAKKTPDLIPLCHPLPITKVAVDLSLDPDLPGLRLTATVKEKDDRKKEKSKASDKIKKRWTNNERNKKKG